MFFAPQSIINFINISVEVQTVRDKLSVLKEYFGHDSFREGQDRITDSLLGGRDVLGIMPGTSDKPGATDVPDTGDTTNVLLWAAALVIGGGAAIGTVVSKKKKREES